MSAYTSPLNVEPLATATYAADNFTVTEPPPCYDESPAGAMVRAAPTLSRRIDRRKVGTKMCAYVSRGQPCPFEGHCAFSHDISRLTTNRVSMLSLNSPAASEPLSPVTELAPEMKETPSPLVRRHQPYLPLFTSSHHKTDSEAEGASTDEEDGASGSGYSVTAASLPPYSSSYRSASPTVMKNSTSASKPPSYEETLMINAQYMAPPPEYSYQIRYRHNPYSYEGIEYLA